MAKKKEEEVYVITPKGLATLAMLHSGLIQTIEDPRLDGFWQMFMQDMEKHGYIQEDKV